MSHNFRELDVWKRAILLSMLVYELTKKYPTDERFGLVSQTQRSAVSIASNIAEGAGRGTDKEFVHFLNIALGSAFEIETQIIIAQKLNYINADEYEQVIDELHVIQPQLNTLIKKYMNQEKVNK